MCLGRLVPYQGFGAQGLHPFNRHRRVKERTLNACINAWIQIVGVSSAEAGSIDQLDSMLSTLCFQIEFKNLRRKGYQGEGACQSMPQCAYHNLCLYSMDVSIVQRPFESSRKAGCPQVVCSLSQSLQLNMVAERSTLPGPQHQ